MRFLIDFIAFIVLQNVGAFVKWAFTGFKRPWKEIIAGNPYYNQWLGAFSFSVGECDFYPCAQENFILTGFYWLSMNCLEKISQKTHIFYPFAPHLEV